MLNSTIDLQNQNIDFLLKIAIVKFCMKRESRMCFLSAVPIYEFTTGSIKKPFIIVLLAWLSNYGCNECTVKTQKSQRLASLPIEAQLAPYRPCKFICLATGLSRVLD